jgi:hypothetical protein
VASCLTEMFSTQIIAERVEGMLRNYDFVSFRPPRRSPTSAQPPTSPAPIHDRQVVLVQPVHDQDDRTRKLVVQSAAERVVVPLVGRLPLGLRERFLGLQRSSMTIMSAPRPVSTPPTEVAMRKPCAVVSNSR